MQTFSVISPTRADLAGGTLDIWPLYCLLGGARTINVALDMYTSAHFEVKPLTKGRIEIHTSDSEIFVLEKPLAQDEIGKLSPSIRLPVTVISSYLKEKTTFPSMFIKIGIESEVPIGSGLGGSSALCVCLCRGLARIFGDFIEEGWQFQMLRWVMDVEAAYLQTPTGSQDYLASLFGGLRCYTSKPGKISMDEYPEEVFENLCKRMLILFSGEVHQSGVSNWELYKSALEGDSKVIRGLHAIKEVANELDTKLNAAIDWNQIGQLFTQEWKIRKELFDVHTSRLDEIIGFLNGLKVLGVKVCGAAQGGSLIALVDPDQIKSVTQACQSNSIQVLRTRCTKQGSKVVSQPNVPS